MKRKIKHTWMVRILLGLFVFFLWVFPAAAQRGYSGWHMGPDMMMGWGGGWLMILFWIMILIGLILLIKWLVQMTRGDKDRPLAPNALEVLKERYARGEIDRQEFLAKKRDVE